MRIVRRPHASREARARRRDRGGRREDTIDAAARADFATAKQAGNYDVANIYAGEAVGLRDEVLPAGVIVRGLAEGAEELLRDRFKSLIDPQ